MSPFQVSQAGVVTLIVISFMLGLIGGFCGAIEFLRVKDAKSDSED